MPKAAAFDLIKLATLSETEVKKESETTSTELFKPGAGRTFRLCQFNLASSAETVVTLEDETTSIGVFFIPTKGTPLVINLATLPQSGILSAAAGNKLKFKTLNTGKFTGTFYGLEGDL